MTKHSIPRTTKTIVGTLALNMDFYNRAQEIQANGCINWMAGKHVQGYGMFGGTNTTTGKGMITVVHRVTMMIKLNRDLVKGEEVVHTCKNNLCVNPDHLVLGDIHTRNKYAKAKGNGYSDDQKEFILHATIEDIMVTFGVIQAKAAAIRSHQRWLYKKEFKETPWTKESK
jgi:hypothetical protein